MDAIRKGEVKPPWWAPTQSIMVIGALVDAVAKYNKLHAEIFGQMDYSMPERISKPNLAKIDMSFYEFLQKNSLQAISGFLMFAHAAQGYGYIKSIPAFYGLWWISPELLNGYIQMSMHQKILQITKMTSNNVLLKAFVEKVVTYLVGADANAVYRTTTMLPEGYGKIWSTIHEKDNLDVRFGVNIKPGGIDRQLDNPKAPVKITYNQDGGKSKMEEYDFLLYTAALKDGFIKKKFVKDTTSDERRIMSTLEGYVLATTLCANTRERDASLVGFQPDVHAAGTHLMQ